ncbi:MAG: DUF2490 domain-containing protein [Tumebacillaceae bacterium]
MVLILLTLPAKAQSSSEFLPEFDVHANVNSSMRLAFQAKKIRENGDPSQAEIGPSIDFFLKPLRDLGKLNRHDLDKSKSRVLVLSFGYRYVPSFHAAAVNRVITQATFNLPLKDKLLISDRNRGELNFSNGTMDWRYRNRLTMQRQIAVHSYHVTPYASAEFYYDDKYHKWSSTALFAGALFPIKKYFQFDPYYEHENNTGKKPNQQIDALGVILNLHF